MHTKGRWIKSGIGDFIWVLDENENYIAEVICSDEEGHYIENEEEREANAHLIAAAPELLEAVKELQKQIHAHYKLNVKKDFSLLLADAAAGKAVARAEGKI